MQTPVPCRKCGQYQLHRSHTRGVFEKAVKRLTRWKPYRCHGCGWRGWLSERRVGRRPPLLKTVLFYAFVVAASLLGILVVRMLMK